MQDAVQPLQFGRRAFCFIWLLMPKLELPECFNKIVMTIIRDEQAEHYSDLELHKQLINLDVSLVNTLQVESTSTQYSIQKTIKSHKHCA